MENNDEKIERLPIDKESGFETARVFLGLCICVLSFYIMAKNYAPFILQMNKPKLLPSFMFLVFGELNAIYTIMYIKKFKEVHNLKGLLIGVLKMLVVIIITFISIHII